MVVRLILAGILLLFALPASAAVEWEVLSEGASSIELEIRLPEASLVEAASGWQLLQMDGLYQTGAAGLPLLPEAVRLLALPPAGEARLETELLDIQTLGTARLQPSESARLRDETTGGDGPRLIEEVLEGEAYPSYRTTRDGVLNLGDPIFARRMRIAGLRVSPAIYDAQSGQLSVARRIRARITFDSPAAMPVDPPGRVGASLASSVLNPTQAAQWEALPPKQLERLRRGANRPLPQLQRSGAGPGVGLLDPAAINGPEFRLRVGGTGMWRAKISDLFAAGLPAGTLRKDLRLYQKRPTHPDSAGFPRPLVADVPFSYLSVGSGDLALVDADEILFHGQHPRDMEGARIVDGQFFPPNQPEPTSNWNSEQVYWVAAMQAGGSWARMIEESVGAAAAAAPDSFLRIERIEQDTAYQDNPNGPSIDRFHWSFFRDRGVRRTVPFRKPVNAASVKVRWELFARLGNTTFVDDFRLEQGANSWPLDTFNVGVNAYRNGAIFERIVPGNIFDDGLLDFVIERESGGVQLTVQCYLSWIELEYWSRYRATSDALSFHTNQVGGDASIVVEGFSATADPLLFDMTDPHELRRILVDAANFLDDGSGGKRLSLELAQGAGERRELIALPRILVNRVQPSQIERDDTPDLVASVGPLAVVAIGPELFRDEMDPWISWRSQEGYSAGMDIGYVDVQQIYDDFSGGMKSPTAIKRFLEYGWLNWGLEATVLVGDANEDTRGVNGGTPDLVPVSLHLQSFSSSRELLASDKWYVIFDAPQAFPFGLQSGPQMLIGRFAVSNETALRQQVAKIIAYEQPAVGQTWRARTLWTTDDAYSTDLIGAGSGCYGFKGGETVFASSQQGSADRVSSALDGTLTGTLWDLDDFTEPLRAGVTCEDEAAIRTQAGVVALENYRSTLNQGWLMVSYQGHANFDVLSHERFFLGTTAQALENHGRPFLFFGMGCHVTDFLRFEEGAGGAGSQASIGELLVAHPTGGAIASYGSSGFEFLRPNQIYMELMAANFFDRGRGTSNILSSLPSQWILGENLGLSELEVLFSTANFRDEMMAQYNLIGDPLLRLDALPPRANLSADSVAVAIGGLLRPAVGTSVVEIGLEAFDESGVASVELTDSEGRDYSGLLTLDQTDPRMPTATFALPIYPQGYELILDVRDGSYGDSWPTSLRYSIPFSSQLFVGGDPVEPGTTGLAPNEEQTVAIEFTSPVSLSLAQLNLSGEGLTLANITFAPLDADGLQWRVTALATGEVSDTQALLLLLDGHETRVAMRSVGGGPGDIQFLRHVAFPNPSSGPTNLVAELDGSVSELRLTVFSLAGDLVYASGPMPATGAEVAFEWDGRDTEGDELANGVYLYRLEATTGAGASARSDMGRLVLMR